MSSLTKIAAPHSAPAAVAGAITTLSDGTPVRRFKRFLAKIGETYYKKNWPQPLHVTDALADHWCSTFTDMKRDGVPVKVTADHADPTKAENCMGDVVDIRKENGWLVEEKDVRGQKNIEIAEANKDVSLEAMGEIKGGPGGRVYRNAIRAVTFTPIPVVHSQPIAASLADEADDDTYYLSTEIPHMKTVFAAIAKLANVGADTVTEGNAVGLIEKHITDTQQAILKASTAKEPDARYMSMACRSAETVWDRLQERGVVDVATRDAFKTLLIGNREAKQFSKIAMSLASEGNDDAMIDLSEAVAKLIESNKPVKTGERTPTQLIAMSRDVPDATNETLKPKNGWVNFYGAQADADAAKAAAK